MFEHLTVIFNTAYYTAVMEELLKYANKLSVNVLGHLKSNKQYQDLEKCIAKITKEVAAEEKSSQFYNLLVDDCADKCTMGQMALLQNI
jgi:hypothetical protein